MFFRREQIKPREQEPLPQVEIEERKKQIEEEEYVRTDEGEAAREYVNKIPEGPRKEAVEMFAYYFLPKFFKEHPKVVRKPKPEEVSRGERPRGLYVNKDFREALEHFRQSFGVSLKDEDINAALDLANEHLDNQIKEETGEAKAAA